MAELAQAQRVFEVARNDRDSAQEAARSGGLALQRLAAGGLSAASLRAASAGVSAGQEAFALARQKASRALRERAERHAELATRDGQLRAAERARDRLQAEEQREHDRQQQRRIDDMGSLRRRSAWPLTFLLAAVVVSAGANGARAEETDDATGSDSSLGAAAPPQLELAFSRIRLRHAELDRRERELLDRERRLSELESTVERRMRELEEISREVELRIASWEEVDGGKSLSRLSRIYAAMPPAQAAPLLQGLDIELATQIVAKMKPKQSSALIALLTPERAKEMSQRIAHPLSMEPVTDQENPG